MSSAALLEKHSASQSISSSFDARQSVVRPRPDLSQQRFLRGWQGTVSPLSKPRGIIWARAAIIVTL